MTKRSSPDDESSCSVVHCVDLTEDDDDDFEKQQGDCNGIDHDKNGIALHRSINKRTKRIRICEDDDSSSPSQSCNTKVSGDDDDDDDDASNDDDVEIVAPIAPKIISIEGGDNGDGNDNGDDNDNDSVVVEGVVNEARFPHMRQHCTRSAFDPNFLLRPRSARMISKSQTSIIDVNKQSCDLCYCFICDCPVKDCKQWASSSIQNLKGNHCCAHEKKATWSKLRTSTKDKRLKQQREKEKNKGQRKEQG